MNIWKSICSLFGSKAQKPEETDPALKQGFIRDKETGVVVETEDPMMAAAIAQAFKTGKATFGFRDENGKFTVQTIETPKPESDVMPSGSKRSPLKPE